MPFRQKSGTDSSGTLTPALVESLECTIVLTFCPSPHFMSFDSFGLHLRRMRFLVRASYLQIYNEQISDLLKPERNNLAIREDKKRGVFVEGLSEWVVSL